MFLGLVIYYNHVVNDRSEWSVLAEPFLFQGFLASEFKRTGKITRQLRLFRPICSKRIKLLLRRQKFMVNDFFADEACEFGDVFVLITVQEAKMPPSEFEETALHTLSIFGHRN